MEGGRNKQVVAGSRWNMGTGSPYCAGGSTIIVELEESGIRQNSLCSEQVKTQNKEVLISSK